MRNRGTPDRNIRELVHGNLSVSQSHFKPVFPVILSAAKDPFYPFLQASSLRSEWKFPLCEVWNVLS
jgi:hypothetical protein